MTAIELHARTPGMAQLDHISTLADAMEIADAISTSDLVPYSLRGKPASILLIYLNGRELDLTMAQSLRALYSPGPGQIGMRYQLMLAKLRQAGHDYWCEFSDDGDTCTFYLKRGDTERTYEASFSVEDAITANLAKRNTNGDIVALSRDNKPLPWMTYRTDMLFARAASRCVSRYAPEVTLGMEVIGPEGPRDAEITLEPQAGPPVPAPGAPGSTPPDAESASSELAALDAEGQAAATVAPQPPAGDGAPATQKEREQVAAALKDIGLDPRRHVPDARRTMTMFCRRHIKSTADLTSEEATQLTERLHDVQDRTGQGEPVVILADIVSGWEHAWFRNDPDGYTVATGREGPL